MIAPGQRNYAGICGMYWEGSAWYASAPAGCTDQRRGGFGKICPIYACAEEQQVEHCGLCPEFPCILLVHMAALRNDDRIASAALRAEVGTELWIPWARERRLWTTAHCPLRTAESTRRYSTP